VTGCRRRCCCCCSWSRDGSDYSCCRRRHHLVEHRQSVTYHVGSQLSGGSRKVGSGVARRLPITDNKAVRCLSTIIALHSSERYRCMRRYPMKSNRPFVCRPSKVDVGGRIYVTLLSTYSHGVVHSYLIGWKQLWCC